MRESGPDNTKKDETGSQTVAGPTSEPTDLSAGRYDEQSGEPTGSRDDKILLSDPERPEAKDLATIQRSPLRLAIIGMWLVFGPILLWCMLMAASFVLDSDPIVEGALWVLAAGVYLAVLCLAIIAYLRSPLTGFGLCRHCGYSLFGLPEPRCPECGTVFDMEEVQEELATVEPARQPRAWPPWNQADLAYALAVGLCYLPGLGAITMVILRPASETFLADIFRVMPCVAQVAGVLLLLSGIRQAYRRREDGPSRLFAIAIAANILLALGILWVPFAIL